MFFIECCSKRENEGERIFEYARDRLHRSVDWLYSWVLIEYSTLNLIRDHGIFYMYASWQVMRLQTSNLIFIYYWPLLTQVVRYSSFCRIDSWVRRFRWKMPISVMFPDRYSQVASKTYSADLIDWTINVIEYTQQILNLKEQTKRWLHLTSTERMFDPPLN